MKTFDLKVYKDEDGDFEDKFNLKFIQQNVVKELDGYYYTVFTGPPYRNTALIESLQIELQNWEKNILNLEIGEILYLTIGIFDEYVEGFFIENIKDNFKVKYGYIADWGMGNRESYTHSLDVSSLTVEFEFETTKEDFISDIEENIEYLSNFLEYPK